MTIDRISTISPLNMVTMNTKAKLNLYLHLCNKRVDGLHDLDSLSIFVNFGDTISVAFGLQGDKIDLLISGNFSKQLENCKKEDNLIYKVVNLMKPFARRDDLGLEIELNKNLPIGSGMAGGTGDGALVMLILNNIWNINFSLEHLQKLAQPLGSDFAMCLLSKSCYVSGTGDILEYDFQFPELYVVMVNPQTEVPTPTIFKNFKGKFKERKPRRSFTDLKSMIGFLNSCENSLTHSACEFEPTINDVLTQIEKSDNCLLSRMTGTGATCFGIYEHGYQAMSASSKLLEDNVSWWVSVAKISL